MSLKKSLVVLALLPLSLGLVSAKEKSSKSKMAKMGAVSTYKVDASQSKINWLGKKITGQHNGTIAIKSGSVQVSEGNVTGGQIVVDAAAITVEDLEGEWKGKLEGHLKSDDFFGVEKNPIITFNISNVVALSAPTEEATHTVTGDLTIKGKTNPITFPAKISMADGKLMADAKGVAVDRTLFDIKYGSGKFFQNLGDKVINDNFWLDFSLVAMK